MTTPPFLTIGKSKIPGAGSGVWTCVGLPSYARLGPYQGEKSDEPDPLGYSWIIVKDKKVDHYITASSTVNSNWMRFVNCARHESEQNLMAFQFRGEMYYRTVAPVAPKAELLVWYGKEYAGKLGISLQSFRSPDTSHLKNLVFLCQRCNVAFTSPLYLKHHQKFCRGVRVSPVNEKHKQHSQIHSGDKSSCHSDANNTNTHLHTTCKEKRVQHSQFNIRTSHMDKEKTKISAKESSHNSTEDVFGAPQNASLSSHTGEKPYSCTLCSYSSSERGPLTNHMRTHTGEKPYSCTLCSYSSSQRGHLTNHMKTHTGEKPYSCTLCSYSSARKDVLTNHMRAHTGEKPYSCTLCSYSSAHRSGLTNHMRTHTGEKPYSCTHCSYSSSLSRNLTDHMRTHTGEKPYSCTLCSYSSAQQIHLTNHMRTHTGEKPYSCTHCSYSAANRSHLTYHMKTHTAK